VGGPKDEDAPRVLSSSPANYSLNFDKKKIEIAFNEFLVLKDINQQLVVSPPLKEKPIVRLKNKSILIELESELRENTTYTINFGEAITDLNEGNILVNYEFVFSTGDYLDSLSVGGRLLNAFDLKPSKEPVHIMLYDDLSDSIVFKEIPIYIGKTDMEGNFRINNLKADSFKIFALKDANNNVLFDPPNENIAFLEEVLNVDPNFFQKIITESIDTTGVEKLADSLEIISSDTLKGLKLDSLTRKALIKIPDQLVVDLFLFQEENENQYLSESNRAARNKIDFSFSRPISDSFNVSSIIPLREDWFIREESITRDSFVYWIVDKEVREMDSIQLELNYVVLDSMNQRAWKKDSLFFIFREPPKSVKNKDKAEDKVEDKVDVLVLSGLKNKAVLDLNKKLILTTETPINYIDTSLIEFYKIKDSLEFKEKYNIIRDSINTRKLHFLKDWESIARYHLILYPGAIMNVFGNTTDTLNINFSIRDEEYYGALIVEADSIQYPAVFQLLDSKNKVVKEKLLSQKETTRFEYIAPGKYSMKVIEDRNANGKWDTGKYLDKRQPEKVYFYNGEIQIRANWDLEIKFINEMKRPPENIKPPNSSTPSTSTRRLP